jgi:hypothetical protein
VTDLLIEVQALRAKIARVEAWTKRPCAFEVQSVEGQVWRNAQANVRSLLGEPTPRATA